MSNPCMATLRDPDLTVHLCTGFCSWPGLLLVFIRREKLFTDLLITLSFLRTRRSQLEVQRRLKYKAASCYYQNIKCYQVSTTYVPVCFNLNAAEY